MILHVDMDAFYASVEQLDTPALRGPVRHRGRDHRTAGWWRRRATRPAASACARPCRSSRPGGSARRACSSGRAWHGTRRSPARSWICCGRSRSLVEPVSIDEAYLDLAGTERLHGPPVELAGALKARIRERVHLTASVGLAPNRFLAKIASDHRKPDGLTVILPEQVPHSSTGCRSERFPGSAPRPSPGSSRSASRFWAMSDGSRPRPWRPSWALTADGCSSWRTASIPPRSPRARRPRA